jgi:hypothetical protein
MSLGAPLAIERVRPRTAAPSFQVKRPAGEALQAPCWFESNSRHHMPGSPNGRALDS